jgi:lipoprotein-anchoring transpeptidase ErfK/SrfK
MMRRICASALILSALSTVSWADPLAITPDNVDGTASPPIVVAAAQQPNLGGGFIQFLFGGMEQGAPPTYRPTAAAPAGPAQANAFVDPDTASVAPVDDDHAPVDPKYDRQTVSYETNESPGTIIIDTPHKFLYLVEGGGTAIRYGIGVGRAGFTWAGVKTVTAKREWPDWRPPEAMLKRQPELPRFMAGGLQNPLGARALYLGNTDYRIHGSNEPWTIGRNVSSGCIRLRNADVIDLYGRVKVGTRVVVM